MRKQGALGVTSAMLGRCVLVVCAVFAKKRCGVRVKGTSYWMLFILLNHTTCIEYAINERQKGPGQFQAGSRACVGFHWLRAINLADGVSLSIYL